MYGFLNVQKKRYAWTQPAMDVVQKELWTIVYVLFITDLFTKKYLKIICYMPDTVLVVSLLGL